MSNEKSKENANEENVDTKSIPKEVEEYNKLLESEKQLDEELSSLKKEIAGGPPMKETMDNLHEYNDIKDSTQIVFGAMAEMQETTVSHFHKKYDVPMD